MAQMTTSPQAARLPMRTLRPPLLPEPVAPPNEGVPAQEQHAARFGVLERAEVDRLGDRGDRRAGPGDRVGVRVVVEDPQLAPVGQVIGGRVDADRAAVACRAPIRCAGIFAITSVMVWPRARRSRARQPHTSTMADMICEPARPTARAISGQAASVRSTRTLARRRRCAHHGTASTSPPMPSACGSGGASGPSRGRHRVPGAAREHRHGHVEPFQPRGEAEPRAERGEHPRGDTGERRG